MEKQTWMRTRWIAALAMVVAFSLQAGEIAEQGKTITPADVERLLVPILPPNGAPGRFGSFWAAEFWVRNSAEVPVVFSSGGPESNLPGGGLIQVDPFTTQRATGGGAPGVMYIVEKAYADEIHLSLRIADVTRRPVSQGTEIPVVRERDWRTEAIELLDIPTDPLVRQTLRIYDPDGLNVGSVRVTIFPLLENVAIAESVVHPRGGSGGPNTDWPFFPGYAEIPDLVEAFPQIGVHERIRVRIEPLTPGMRFWAFVTITDNMTQQVTVVPPR